MIVRDPYQIPPTTLGMKIGLFGGSFNPPHKGHLLVSKIALRKLQLDRIWWIVTPGNPLKDTHQLLPVAERIALCRKLVHHPDICITAFEIGFNNRYTADTVAILTGRRPSVHWVWVMGADNLGSFHRWNRWRDIARDIPLAIIDRPGSTMSPNSTPATHSLSKFRLDERDAKLLAGTSPPAWTFIHGPRSHISSTQIRNTKSE